MPFAATRFALWALNAAGVPPWTQRGELTAFSDPYLYTVFETGKEWERRERGGKRGREVKGRDGKGREGAPAARAPCCYSSPPKAKSRRGKWRNFACK